jgi:monoamine oxidase
MSPNCSAKAIDQKALDAQLTAEDRDRLKEALRGWGMLDKDMQVREGPALFVASRL